MDVVDLLIQRSSLADEQYLELLRSQDPSLRNKLFAAAQEAVNYLFHRRVYMQGRSGVHQSLPAKLLLL